MNDYTVTGSVGYHVWRYLDTFCSLLFVYYVKIALLGDIL